ncbi:proteinase-activated receptor 1-like [Python bivittatus]|uniref:Proteinase-activated receptor 1 n=1 Tax=Python bivittatus TaxID=176946 RepID=A0A9F2R5R5_PYTBI|nr:proteinase-activated receptor 1-like [Python bivittatus]
MTGVRGWAALGEDTPGVQYCWWVLALSTQTQAPDSRPAETLAFGCCFLMPDSSDQIILSSKPRKLLPTLIDSPNGAPLDIHNKEGNHILFSDDGDAYLTNPWLTQFLPVVDIIAFVLGLPLNMLAILIFVMKTKFRKPAVVYMFNLASADLLLLSVLPFKIAYLLRGHNWVFGPTMCQLATATFFCNMYCSILLMTAISIDRFLAVVYPMQSLSWRTVKCASVVCLTIWLLAIAGAIPLLVFDHTLWIPQLNITTCLNMLNISATVKFFSYYSFALSIFFFFIPLLISTTCYICIIRQLSLSRVMAKPGRKRRAILLSAAVMGTFLLFFGPPNILSLMQLFSPYHQLHSIFFAYMLSLCLSPFNCCFDPFIYYYASSECQRQVWRFLCHRRLLLVKKGSQTSSNIAPFPSGLEHSFHT